MILEAELPDGPRRRRRPDLLAYGAGRVFDLVCLVRMNADSETRLGPELLDVSCLRGLFLVARREDDHGPLDPGFSRAGDHRVEVAGKHFIGEMTVGVDHRLVRCAMCEVV